MKIRNLKKTNQVLIFTFLIIAGLYYAAPLLVPLTVGIFLAALIFPVVRWLEKKTRVGKISSAFFGTIIIFLGVGMLMFFLINQLGTFLRDIIESKEDILNYFQELQKRAASVTGFSLEQQQEMMRDSVVDILNVTQSYLSGIFADVTMVLLKFLLILVYVFLLLLNRDKFVTFLTMYTPDKDEKKVQEIISKTRKVAHKYLWGRIQVMLILGIMYLIAFTTFDIRHAWLLILFGTLITIIPYIGPFVSGLVPILFLIIFGGSSLEIILFAIVIAVIQLIESYVLEPIIIGSEVEQSPLFIIIAIILGGMLWGPVGLILFVPIFSILKILFDYSSNMKPVGFLMGYERPGSGESLLEKFKTKFKKK